MLTLSPFRQFPQSATVITGVSLPFYGYANPSVGIGAIGDILQSQLTQTHNSGIPPLACAIYLIGSRSGVYDLQVTLIQAWSMNHFDQIVIVDSTGALRTYTSASASIGFGFPGEITWTWGAGVDLVWNASGQQRTLFMR